MILLMFGVGLHFSIGTLLKVRNIALPGAVVQIAVATIIGWGLARLWDWSTASGIVFGLALSVASTVVLLRALEQRNELDTEQGRIAVGWLVVEDLAMGLDMIAKVCAETSQKVSRRCQRSSTAVGAHSRSYSGSRPLSLLPLR